MGEDCAFNDDETHFSVNDDNGHTLAMKGDTEVKYSDVVSEAMGMTIMVMLGGGSKPRFEMPLIFFVRCDWRIRSVPIKIDVGDLIFASSISSYFLQYI